ncbi:hypothetical protein [Spongiimicrobium salis]|uniref:hypothetical protein n=1 Tax=Spongiimicrobium salis TaxID=1667022 RepID=UPI00374CA177
MIKRYLTLLGLCFSMTLLSSCFEILEEINFNADGSGHMLVTVNLSKSRTKLASVMLLDSVNGHKVPSKDDINESLKQAVAHLKETKGVSNIKKTADFDNYIFTISCDFEKIENIDAIFKDAIRKQNKKESTNFSTTNFSYNDASKVFKRHFSYDTAVKKSFDRLKKEDKAIFEDASYTAIYRFKNEVQSVSNTNAKISPNKKAVFLRVAAMDLILGQKNLKNNIQLSK